MRGLDDRSRWPPLLVLAPAAMVAGAMLLPLLYLVIRALGASDEAWDLLFRMRVLHTLGRTALLVASVTAASIVIAVPLAWLTVRTDLPFRRWWAVTTALPLVIPSYIGGFIVVVALGPRGMLQGLLESLFGVEHLPEIYGFPGALLTLTLLSFPYVLLPVRAVLWRMDPSLEQASHSFGCGAWNTFRRVTLPLLRPSIAAGSLLVALYTLSDFGAVSLLGYETFTWSIYLQYESAFDRTIAAALSLVLVLLALVIMVAEAASRGLSRYYRTSAGTAALPTLVRLGKWRWPALAFCAALVLAALVAPVAILLHWVVRGVTAGEPLDILWGPAGNSLSVSALAAVVTVMAALPVALLAVRYRGWLSLLLERFSYVGFALPGIVVALALVFFASNYVWPVYQTRLLLVFAYVVLFFPAALGAARAALLQISPRVEEAALCLGKPPYQVFMTVTAPLLMPGLLAGAAMVFLLTLKELPATLILSPIGFSTLATATWSAASDAFFARSAMPALLLILMALVALLLIIRAEGRAARYAGWW